MNDLRPAVAAHLPRLVETRRDLHQHAELSTKEHRTQRVIIDRLLAAGLEDVRAIADTGVTGLVRGAQPGPNLLWRADTDALPLDEMTSLPFASTTGAMHACGHDGHVAVALALAEILQAARGRLRGTLRFAFQPAEEHVGGAERMIREGVMREPAVERAFGLHLWASEPTGRVLVRPGAIFAAATHFRIIVRGRGGHAAAPHQTIDTVVVAAHVIVALQTIVSRNIDPEETAVLSVGRLQAGSRGNIIPNEAMMSGTIRTFDPAVLARILRRMDEVIRGVTAAFRAEYQFDHSMLPAVVNDPASAALVEGAAAAWLGPASVGATRATGADDMAFFLEEAPGAYFLVGAAPKDRERVFPHHHPQFDIDEDALPLALELALRVVEAASGSHLA